MSVTEFQLIFKRGADIKTCIVSRMKQITSPGWMHDKLSDLVHWENLGGAGGEGGGRGDRDGEHM